MNNNQINPSSSSCRSLAVNFSKQLWAYLEVKQLTIQCIAEDAPWSKYQSTQLQNTLRTGISQEINKLLLPQHVNKFVRFIVETMGFRLQLWAKEIKSNEKFSVHWDLYLDYIRWTDYGSIDTSETVRAMYYSKVLLENSDTWMELCELCLEDCLIDLWPKVSEILEHQVINSHTLLSLYWCCRMQNRLEEQLGNFMRIIDYNGEYSLEENIFVHVFACGNYSAVKYFWFLLNDDERQRTIGDVAMNLHVPSNPQPGSIFYPGNDKGLDFVIFLLKELSHYDLNHLWIGLLRFEYVLIQLLHWPIQGLFMDSLEKSWVHHGHISYTSILIRLLDFIDSLHSTDGADSLYRGIFCDVWESLVGDFRGYVDFLDIIISLWEMKEIDWLDYIVNDDRLKISRETFVFYIQQCFSSWQGSLDTDYFEEFIEKVLVTEEEREQFRIDVASELNPLQIIYYN